MASPLPFMQQSNLSKMESFSYRSHSCKSIATISDNDVILIVPAGCGLSCTYPGSQVLMHIVGGNRSILLVDVPQLQCHVVAAENVPPILAERDVRYAGNDLREEGLVGLYKTNVPSVLLYFSINYQRNLSCTST